MPIRRPLGRGRVVGAPHGGHARPVDRGRVQVLLRAEGHAVLHGRRGHVANVVVGVVAAAEALERDVGARDGVVGWVGERGARVGRVAGAFGWFAEG